MAILITIFLIAFVCGFAAAFSVIARYHRLTATRKTHIEEYLNHSKDLLTTSVGLAQTLNERLGIQAVELRIKTEAIQRIVYDAHHRGLNPIFKTLRGLMQLLQMSSTDIHQREYLALMERQILQAENEELSRTRAVEHLQE
jgi:hypothetical protein